ncbi:PDDEXK nuclease domain-containing protein [Mucilaginibacter flavidus]|uniref:PDDEXK nuclease domain-containing protein n=1 Tax=Mucilaginibacter flavidus TaxID=2949309 RepID=UPI0020932B7F|nr:PDDEXK nuclease domain-containing protein [Mucilaginibacter flavidus]MCO5948265.1 PDDEXK nuclease domain-containing protein [Mucilaginibacter flavidus]
MALEKQFSDVIILIKELRNAAFKAVNVELINLYWQVGAYVSQRIEAEEWGKSVVQKLALYIEQTEPDIRGFSDKNLWRMKQFYEAYKNHQNLSALLREISWTNNLTILSRTKSIEEKEFYLRLCVKEKYSSRELERQMNSGVFERVMIGNQKLPAVMREFDIDVSNTFKDSYVFEFLNLPELHSERQLQKALIVEMKNFILELGKDFLFVGEEYRLQVGNSDFMIDLLFYHRSLRCLIAFELKADKFKPEHLGQLNFYLEALDRDVKKEHENPSIGILLCKNKDIEIVEYALSRNLSPAMVAEYQTLLPNKKLLQRKLHEIFESSADNSLGNNM